MLIRVGETSGPYRWVRFLGEGSSAEVWAAWRGSRLIAVKVLRGAARRRSFLEAIHRETRIGALIQGVPGVVAVQHVESWDGHVFLEMPYVRGPSLDQVLIGRHWLGLGAVPPRVAVGWASAVLDTLDQVARRVVPDRPRSFQHRDIKPGNLLLRAHSGEVCVTDFGVARAEAELGFEATATGVVKGSPRFMAPEAVLEQPMDARSDQYGVAVVLYELLTLRPLFSGPDVAHILLAVSDGFSPDALDHVPGPPELRTVLRTMLSRDPEGRFATTAEAALALRELPLKGPSIHDTLHELVTGAMTREGVRLFDDNLRPFGETPLPGDDEETLVDQPPPTPANEAEEETELADHGALIRAMRRQLKGE